MVKHKTSNRSHSYKKFQKELNQALIINAIRDKPLRFKEIEKQLHKKMSKPTISSNLRELVEKKILEQEFDRESGGVVYIVGEKKADRIIRTLKKQVEYYQRAIPTTRDLIRMKWKVIEESADYK